MTTTMVRVKATGEVGRITAVETINVLTLQFWIELASGVNVKKAFSEIEYLPEEE